MKPNLKYNPVELRRKFLVYSFLQDYYTGHLWQRRENWQDFLIMLEETRYQEEIPFFDLGMQLILKPTQEALYDFNRLFIGPGKLLAPPYESSYRSAESLVMQEETLAVRRYYSLAGLAVVKQNNEPDDFIGFELEFLRFLIYQSRARDCSTDEGKAETYLNLYRSFLAEHLGLWVAAHCEDVLKHSTTYFCKGMAMLTKGFVEHEMTN